MNAIFKTGSAAILSLALGATAACNRERPGDAPPEPSECGANLLDSMRGSVPTAEVKAYISARVGDRPIRYFTRGDPITMDYNPARLNVVLGRGGRIQRFYCG